MAGVTVEPDIDAYRAQHFAALANAAHSEEIGHRTTRRLIFTQL